MTETQNLQSRRAAIIEAQRTAGELSTPEEIHDSEDTGLTAGAVYVIHDRIRTETVRERRERYAEERDKARRFRLEFGEAL